MQNTATGLSVAIRIMGTAHGLIFLFVVQQARDFFHDTL
jgi:hypothetical protein